ncbi:MAG: isoprenylcysteine carboxylmethyltransferase family protein [Alphaproteobacteria bacterium]
MVSFSEVARSKSWYDSLARSTIYERAINGGLGLLYLYWAATAAIGLVLFIQGWAEQPSHLFAVCSIASRVAIICFLLLFAALVLTRTRPVRRSRGILPRFHAAVGAFLPMLLVTSPLTIDTAESNLASAVLIMVGNGLAVVSLRYLGRSTSIMPEARRLVTRGPYAFLRHPLYFAEEIAVLGILLPRFSLLTLLIAVVHLGFQIHRMKHEEGVLREAFPDYDATMMGKARFIPGLY